MITNRRNLVAIIGAQGAGKSTVVQKIKGRLANQSHPSMLVVHEVARKCPYSVGVKSDLKAQTWIFRTQLILEELSRSLTFPTILDRCLLDQYAYYRFWNGRNHEIELKIKEALPYYRTVFFLTPNPAFLIDDGLRPINPEHQIEIDNLISDTLVPFLPALNLVRCSSQKDTLVDEVLNTLQQEVEDFDIKLELPLKGQTFGQDILPILGEAEVIQLVDDLIECIPDSNLSRPPRKISGISKELETWLQKICK